MSDKAYDILKKIALYMPLLITFATGMCELYHCQYTTYIVGTLALINALIAGIVEVSSKLYYKKIEKLNKEWEAFNLDEDD